MSLYASLWFAFTQVANISGTPEQSASVKYYDIQVSLRIYHADRLPSVKIRPLTWYRVTVEHVEMLSKTPFRPLPGKILTFSFISLCKLHVPTTPWPGDS